MVVPHWPQLLQLSLISSHCSLFFVCATGLWERWRYYDRSERRPCARASWEWRVGSGITTRHSRYTRASWCSFSFLRRLSLERRHFTWLSPGSSVAMKSRKSTELPCVARQQPALMTDIWGSDGNHRNHFVVFDPRTSGEGAVLQHGIGLSSRSPKIR